MLRTVDEPMTLFIERCERLLSENDDTMVDYFASLTTQSDAREES